MDEERDREGRRQGIQGIEDLRTGWPNLLAQCAYPPPAQPDVGAIPE